MKKYQYSDLETASNLNYYRLKQVDYDGTITLYPNIIYNDKCFGYDDYKLNIYPNPSNQTITLKNPHSFNRYSIINTLGQLIKQDFVSPNPISISDIANGVYLFQLVDKKNVLHSKKIVIEHSQN